MKPTNMMNLEELLDEKEALEKKTSLNGQESARLNKILTEISKKSNKSSVVDSFTNNDLKSQLQLQYVNIADIMMPDYDDRSGIDRNKIEELAASIKEHGLIQNPVLKDLGNGKFEKKVGRRRILATKYNGDEKILVKILPSGLTEVQEDYIIWDENNQREDLNLYDKVRFHLKFIIREFNFTSYKEAIALVNNCHLYKKQKETASIENQELATRLEALIIKLGSYKTISSLMNNLQVLNFDERILDAMRESKISYRLAYLLNKSIAALESVYADNKEELFIVINYIINQEYSVTEAESYINKIIKSNTVKDEIEIKFNKAVKKFNKKIGSIKVEDREKIVELLNDFLKQNNL